ncbi:MAG: AAC(3) family N-acetyltransferase [Anaeroplasmataceae bacterium]|nr:AAC(3) family N-acetyltransferase [Anaeroplasmataceae bacterium]MDE6414710.1 AAC(3) family N-acetyltransferase [Anaeroplasmataceae bacterium]
MLNKIVDVIVDRPLYSVHPKEKDLVYELNYGYIPNTISPVDKEEIDAYILDVDQPVQSYKGRVIAIIHRFGDEDKLIVSNRDYSKEEIYKKTYFQEQYFKSYIEMAYTTKEDILFDLSQHGFKNTDTVLLHTSLKSFGAIEGKDILTAFKEYFSSGLVILPTHSWSSITKNNDVFDVKKTPSCVGALTNLALADAEFKRSLHPTHSVCAYGKKKEEYLKLDLNQSTPVSPTGCFGSLWKMDAKILFLGAPLSKNTLIHSIEEEMNVPDRFTKEIYHFTSIGYDGTYSYEMPRHYSTKREHLSENYTKLLPHLLEYEIAKELYIGNSKTILVYAKACYDYVKYLLEKNIHLFDDDKEYEDNYEGYKKTKQ